MLVDGASTDGASTRERDLRLAEARHERAEHEDARAHLLDELVWGLGLDVGARRDRHLGGIDHDVASEEPEEGGCGVDVAKRGHIAEPARAVREEGRAEDGERGVLRPADADRSLECGPAAKTYGVHEATMATSEGLGATF